MRRLSAVGVALILTLVAAAPAFATHIVHTHAGGITNISGACDVTWNHTQYAASWDNEAESWTDETSSCDNVQTVIRWYVQDFGYITTYGPQVDLWSYVHRASGVYSISWSKACGNAVCSGQLA